MLSWLLEGEMRAYCSARIDVCKWRIHASTMGDNVTVKVKRNHFPHDCNSTRRSGNVKHASKFWCCEMVKDWLVDDATVHAIELQRRIKDKFKRCYISTSGRRKKNRRFKAAIKGGRGNKGRNQCLVCGQYGHHWHTCKNGDPADIEAMKLERGEPKKKKKKVAPTPTCTTETSIVPFTAPRMTFSATLSTSTSVPRPNKRKRKSPSVTQSSTASIKSGTGSNQVDPIPLPMLLPSPYETTTQEKAPEKEKSAVGKKRTTQVNKKAASVKKKAAEKEADKNTSSPAMGTRSKVQSSPSSPAMETRSKRQLLI